MRSGSFNISERDDKREQVSTILVNISVNEAVVFTSIFQLFVVLALLGRILDADWSEMTYASGGVLFTVLWEGIEKHCAGVVPRGPTRSLGVLIRPLGPWFVNRALVRPLGPDSVPQALSCSGGPGSSLGARSVPVSWFVLWGPGWSRWAWSVQQGPDSSCGALVFPWGPLFVLRGPG